MSTIATNATCRPGRLITRPVSPDAPLPRIDPVIARLPRLFRLESINRLPLDASRHVARAELFHAQAALSVFWIAGCDDTHARLDALVSVRWLGRAACIDGAIRVVRLVEADEPELGVNLFDTVPYSWSADRTALKRAETEWLRGSHRTRRAFNARYWDAPTFRAYVEARCGAALTH